MFDLLKKKIGGFVDSLSKKVVGDRSENEPEIKEIKAELEENSGFELSKGSEAELKKIRNNEAAQAESERIARSESKKVVEVTKYEIQNESKLKQEVVEKAQIAITKSERIQPYNITKQKVTGGIESKKTVSMSKPEASVHKPNIIEKKEREMKGKEFRVAPTLITKLKSVVMPEVTIKDNDVSSVLEDFEMQLLTADVALPVAEEIAKEVRSKLVGSSIKSNQLENQVKQAIFDSIIDVTKQDDFDLFKLMASKEKPLRILFIGPNGAGKTTTIAKFAHLLTKNGKTCVIAASDTFRAAAIEQTTEHAKRLNVPVIKHDYGSDPAAVAFDAVKYAMAKELDVVLIDSAGRQETNYNLIAQLKKIERVVKPDLKLFVGEGISGNALLSQVSEFHKAVGLDGVILTKMDVDAKGGTVISIKKATGVPILYLGVGQEYDDLISFDSSYVAKRIMAS